MILPSGDQRQSDTGSFRYELLRRSRVPEGHADGQGRRAEHSAHHAMVVFRADERRRSKGPLCLSAHAQAGPPPRGQQRTRGLLPNLQAQPPWRGSQLGAFGACLRAIEEPMRFTPRKQSQLRPWRVGQDSGPSLAGGLFRAFWDRALARDRPD
jgi:hypothetical protein